MSKICPKCKSNRIDENEMVNFIYFVCNSCYYTWAVSK